nr:RNA polymerase sigma factor SigJ [Diaminobutyricibacter tongyongensis]
MVEHDAPERFDRIADEARAQYMAVAFRMLGTVDAAEDAVQEAFLRWYRMDAERRQRVRNPAGWLMTTLSRICLDILGSARVRRETYIGPWLPEPLPENSSVVGSTDPELSASIAESVSTAMLIVLERMTPAERVAFVLHDVFDFSFHEVAEMTGRSQVAARQLAATGRRRVEGYRRNEVSSQEHDRVVRAFRTAAEGGDVNELMTLLAPEAALLSDGGGVVRAALKPIHGARNVARFFLGVMRRRPDVKLTLSQSGNRTVILLVDGNGVGGVLNLGVEVGSVAHVWIQWNPNKLTTWQSADNEIKPRSV